MIDTLPEEIGIIRRSTIETDLDRQGYYYLQGVGRLHKGGLTRTGIAYMVVANIFFLAIVFILFSAHDATLDLQISRQTAQLAHLQDVAAQAQQTQQQLGQCVATMNRYQASLAQATQAAQTAAPTNPNAAQILRLLLLLKQVL